MLIWDLSAYTRLWPIFDHARDLRNESGHPSGEGVTGEDAEARLLLFSESCERVAKWIEEVQKT